MKEISTLTFNKACSLEGMDAKKVEASLKKSFDFLSPKEKTAMIAHAMCVIMIKAANRIANGGKPWKANYKDASQTKYEVWWWCEGGSSGFRYYDYVSRNSTSYVGSRLAFISVDCARALCRDNAGFVKLWNKYAL